MVEKTAKQIWQMIKLAFIGKGTSADPNKDFLIGVIQQDNGLEGIRALFEHDDDIRGWFAELDVDEPESRPDVPSFIHDVQNSKKPDVVAKIVAKIKSDYAPPV